MNTFAPNAARLIRMDHSHVRALFLQYRADLPTASKHALVRATCRALGVHTTVEEQVFYPAVRALDSGAATGTLESEHAEMKRLMARLDAMAPEDPAYDRTFLALMRETLHHVADEETSVLPDAERALGNELHALGAEMVKRRYALTMPHGSDAADSLARGWSLSAIAMAAVSTLLAYVAWRTVTAQRRGTPQLSR